MERILGVYFEIKSEEELTILKHWLKTNCRFPFVCDKVIDGTVAEVKKFLKEGN